VSQRPYSSQIAGEPSLIIPRSPPGSSAISGLVYRCKAEAHHVFIAGDIAQIVLD
jgi:hypothetical protein